jgi:hypothetical protein
MSDDDDFMNDSEDENAFDSPEDSDGVSTTTPTTSPSHSPTPSSHSRSPTHLARSPTPAPTISRTRAHSTHVTLCAFLDRVRRGFLASRLRVLQARERSGWVFLACGAWRRNAECVHSFIASQQLAHTYRATTAAALMLT